MRIAPAMHGTFTRRRFLSGTAAAFVGGIGSSVVGCGSGPRDLADATEAAPIASRPPAEAAPTTITPRPPRPALTPEPHWAPDSLRTLATKLGFIVGAEAHYGYLWPGREKVPYDPYTELPKQFNGAMISSIHMANPWNFSLMPERGTYNFQPYDYVVNWARRNDMSMYGQPLVWGRGGGDEHVFLPRWFLDEVEPGADASAVLKEYVSAVVSHFKEDITAWGIVNELFQPFSASDVWLEKVGPNYPDIAFAAAREANPDAVLVLNGVDNFIDARVPIDIPSEYFALARRLAGDGLLDGVGFELHLQGHRPPGKDALRNAIAPFQSLKNGSMKIYFTEVDVNLQEVTGNRDERWRKQAEIYADLLELALEIGVSGFYLFGNSDELSWLTGALTPPWGGPLAEGTIFDKDGHAKPAFGAMQDVFRAALMKRGIN